MRHAMIAVLLLSMPAAAQQIDTQFCQNVTFNPDGTIAVKGSIEIFNGDVVIRDSTIRRPGIAFWENVDIYEYIRKTCGKL